MIYAQMILWNTAVESQCCFFRPDSALSWWVKVTVLQFTIMHENHIRVNYRGKGATQSKHTMMNVLQQKNLDFIQIILYFLSSHIFSISIMHISLWVKNLYVLLKIILIVWSYMFAEIAKFNWFQENITLKGNLKRQFRVIFFSFLNKVQVCPF